MKPQLKHTFIRSWSWLTITRRCAWCKVCLHRAPLGFLFPKRNTHGIRRNRAGWGQCAFGASRSIACAGIGTWFCDRCQRVVNLPLDIDEPARCPHCKKQTAKWHPPVRELQTV